MTTVSVEKILVKERLWNRIKDISNGKILTVFIKVNPFKCYNYSSLEMTILSVENMLVGRRLKDRITE